MYNVPSASGVAKVVVDAATIEGSSEPILIYENLEEPRKAAPDA
jgi:ATP-dependent Clp protease ATP-binding subunit ClpX